MSYFHVLTHHPLWFILEFKKDETMASVRFIGGSVSHIARSRSLGEHIGPQHRLRSAHRSVRTSHSHYKPTGSYRLVYVFVYTVHAVLATMTLDLIYMFFVWEYFCFPQWKRLRRKRWSVTTTSEWVFIVCIYSLYSLYLYRIYN